MAASIDYAKISTIIRRTRSGDYEWKHTSDPVFGETYQYEKRNGRGCIVMRCDAEGRHAVFFMKEEGNHPREYPLQLNWWYRWRLKTAIIIQATEGKAEKQKKWDEDKASTLLYWF